MIASLRSWCLFFAVLATSVSDSRAGDRSADEREPKETVLLLHGLGLNAWSLKRIEWALRRDGYRVVNLSYPSRSVPIERLADTWLPEALRSRGITADTRLHVVTHSMGGIIVRAWRRAAVPDSPRLGRVVMIAPPHGGSELVDRIRSWRVFRWFTGINGRRLSTGADSFPLSLGPWTDPAPLGIIAGDRTLDPFLKRCFTGPTDGKVSVAATRLDGMSAHRVMPYSHTWLIYRGPVIQQVRSFLRSGSFLPPAPGEPARSGTVSSRPAMAGEAE